MRKVNSFPTLLAGCVLVLFGCQNPGAAGGPPDKWESDSAPPIIYHSKNGDGTIQSYSADVEVYSKDTRKTGSAKLVQKYKLAAKLIDGRLYTRIDLGAEDSTDNQARAYISDGRQMVVLNPVSLRVLARANLSQNVGDLQDLSKAQTKSLFGRIAVDEWKREFLKLNFDITEDQAAGRLGVSIPTNLLVNAQSFPGLTVHKARLLYDTIAETPAGLELSLVDEEGEQLLFLSQPVYAEKDGVPVKVADVMQISDSSQNLENGEYEYAVPEATVDDIPVVTEAELAQMEADGASITYIDPVVTPAQPDSPSTTIVLSYDQIHLNETPDSFFKIAF